MDRIWLRHMYFPPPPAPPQPPAGPVDTGSADLRCPQPQAVQARLLPHSQEGPPPRKDPQALAKAAVATAIGQGSCFGLAFALSNHLRLRGNPAVAGVAGFVLPSLAGYLTAPAQRALFEALDFQSTQPPRRARWHEFIPSVCIYTVNMLYANARFLPRPVPGTPGAALTTLALSMAGTAAAGVACEASAQWAGGRPAPMPDDDEIRRTAVGRALSLVPMGLANLRLVAHVTHLGRVPEALRMQPLQIGLFTWGALRKDLMPPGPDGDLTHGAHPARPAGT